MRFGTTDAPRLTRDNLNSASVAKFISYIHNLIRGNAFDDSVMQLLIDRATITLLGFYFKPSVTARRHPIDDHWTMDWDVAIIIQFEMATGIVVESRKKAHILINDMDQSRRDTINEWSLAEDTIPYLNNYEILKDLSRCFTSKDNPAGTSKSNVQFQRDLNAMIQGDNEYYTSPTLREGSSHHASMGGADANTIIKWLPWTRRSNDLNGPVGG